MCDIGNNEAGAVLVVAVDTNSRPTVWSDIVMIDAHIGRSGRVAGETRAVRRITAHKGHISICWIGT